jgi:cell division protein FtsA
VPSIGLRKGSIIDIESTAKAIDECLNTLEKLTGIEILSAVVGFPEVTISIINNHAAVAVGNPFTRSPEMTRSEYCNLLVI